MKKINFNKPIVKKKTPLSAKIGLAITLVGVLVPMIYHGISRQTYKSQNKINEYAEVIKADMSVMQINEKGIVQRMQHNNGLPVYVSIDNEFSNEQKINIEQSLDYVFGVVGSINDKYYYEIVDKKDMIAQKVLGLTCIEYNLEGELEEFHEGDIQIRNDLTLSTKTLSKFAIINVDERMATPDSKTFMYTLNHELLHMFGFEDVYYGEGCINQKIISNTIMDINAGEKNQIISPNDYKMLLAAYDETTFKNDEQKTQYFNEIKQKISEYEKYYYSVVEERVVSKDNFENINLTSGVFEWTEKQGTKFEYKNVVKIDNGKYTYSIFDKDGKLLTESNGEILKGETAIFLKGVNIDKCRNPFIPYSEGGEIFDAILKVGEEKSFLYFADRVGEKVISNQAITSTSSQLLSN